jgi:hypothetical protein
MKDGRKLRQWIAKALDAARRKKAAKPKRTRPRSDLPF